LPAFRARLLDPGPGHTLRRRDTVCRVRARPRRRPGPAELLALACALAACGADEPAPADGRAIPPPRARLPARDPLARPNVVLVTIDTLRADRCSAYGYPRPTTPHLEALSREGARFEVAYAPTPSTLPSHAALFTSLHPAELGVRKNGHPLPAEADTLAERLQRAGYRTAAFVSSFVLSRPFRLDQGFESYDDDFRGAASSVPPDWPWAKYEVSQFDRRAADTTDAAIAWLRAAPSGAPFLLWVHYFDPHQPLLPLEPYLSQFARPEPLTPKQRMADLYDAEVRSTDDQLGRLLEALDELSPGPRTLAIVTSDHGEGLWDHGWLQHGALLYEEAVRVPLVLRWPGRIAPGLRPAGPVSLIDVLPTLLGLLGLEPGGPELRGTDLGPLLDGGAPDPDRRVFLQRQPFTPGLVDHRRLAGVSRAVRWRHWKLIDSPRELGIELFDLERDPQERESVASQHPDLAASLMRELEDWRRGLRERPEPREPLPEELRRGLEALGYGQ
jgi:arylsulfatase A-like enzyme